METIQPLPDQRPQPQAQQAAMADSVRSSNASTESARRTPRTNPQRARQIFQSAIRYAQGSSRPALSISPDCQGGIIIKKSHYSDFIGPGAAVVNRHDLQGNEVVPVGRLKFVPLKTPEQRQDALAKRVEYLRRLEEIARSPVPLRRSCQIVEHLCLCLSQTTAQAIADELVASLVGVTPMAIQLAWRSAQQSEENHDAYQKQEDSIHAQLQAQQIDPQQLETSDAKQRLMMQSRLPSLS